MKQLAKEGWGECSRNRNSTCRSLKAGSCAVGGGVVPHGWSGVCGPRVGGWRQALG